MSYSSSKNPILKIDDATYSYGDAKGSLEFKLCNLRVDPGDIVFFHGSSGCGKTTFLNLLAGGLDKGKFRREFVNARCVAYVMHESTLLPWKTVLGNVETESKLRNKSSRREEFQRLCQAFNLDNVGGLLPKQLSLGMRQRVEISKAISFEPELLLLDEAFAGIDTITKTKVFYELQNWVKKLDAAVIATAHQITDVLRLATKIYLIENGTLGRLIKINIDQTARLFMSVRELLELPEATVLFDEKSPHTS